MFPYVCLSIKHHKTPPVPQIRALFRLDLSHALGWCHKGSCLRAKHRILQWFQNLLHIEIKWRALCPPKFQINGSSVQLFLRRIWACTQMSKPLAEWKETHTVSLERRLIPSFWQGCVTLGQLIHLSGRPYPPEYVYILLPAMNTEELYGLNVLGLL